MGACSHKPEEKLAFYYIIGDNDGHHRTTIKNLSSSMIKHIMPPVAATTISSVREQKITNLTYNVTKIPLDDGTLDVR